VRKLAASSAKLNCCYNYSDTGGRYNPTVDSWAATTTTNAPSLRGTHTTVWTGSEMIVWGEAYQDPFSFVLLNTDGRYNPSTDSWTATSSNNAPHPRYMYTAVSTGNEMIIWADPAAVN
jgi:N-acetylneuraminic acid mutarotase